MEYRERDRRLARLQAVFERAGQIAGYLGGSLILLGAILVGVEVVIRRAFSVSIGGADELTAYGLAIAFAWGAAHTLFQKGHVRVDSLYIYLPLRVRRILDLLSLVVLVAVVGFLTYRGSRTLYETIVLSARSSTPLATPLWIPQSLWLLGLAFFLSSTLLLLIRAFHAFAGGDFNRIREIAGAALFHERPIDQRPEPSNHSTGARQSGDKASQ